ncbi:MAG: CDP-diacylglycerol--glycerol-3-phosphate 3-phosphatidyltransferase [Rhodospirillales bacterium]|nr:CDP-diacylglycerol--glycerol-3-phosphate 3-phosphatidyltransferase [Rhodospirillales bacterium]
MTERPAANPLLTLPNLLTFFRIVLAVPIAVLVLLPGDWARWLAFAAMAVASLTDWADGYLARKHAQVSPLGRLLDPIADKLLVAVVLVALVAARDLGGWELIPVIAILGREILISGLREYMMEYGETVAVTKLAKWKTTLQLAAVALTVLAPALGSGWGWAAGVLVWSAAILTVITGWDYTKGALSHMARPVER